MKWVQMRSEGKGGGKAMNDRDEDLISRATLMLLECQRDLHRIIEPAARAVGATDDHLDSKNTLILQNG